MLWLGGSPVYSVHLYRKFHSTLLSLVVLCLCGDLLCESGINIITGQKVISV